MQNCKKYNELQKLQICKIAKIGNMQSWEPTVWEPTVLGLLLLGLAAHSPSLTATWGPIIWEPTVLVLPILGPRAHSLSLRNYIGPYNASVVQGKPIIFYLYIVIYDLKYFYIIDFLLFFLGMNRLGVRRLTVSDGTATIECKISTKLNNK